MYQIIRKDTLLLPTQKHLLLNGAFIAKESFYLYDVEKDTLHCMNINEFPLSCANLYFVGSDEDPLNYNVLGVMNQGFGILSTKTIIASQFHLSPIKFTKVSVINPNNGTRNDNRNDDLSSTNCHNYKETSSYYTILFDKNWMDDDDDDDDTKLESQKNILPFYDMDRAVAINRYKNYIFILSNKVSPEVENPGAAITILKICKKTNIMIKNDSNDINKTYLEFIGNFDVNYNCGHHSYGAIIWDCKDQADVAADGFSVSLLVFGGKWRAFRQSFCDITINVKCQEKLRQLNSKSDDNINTHNGYDVSIDELQLTPESDKWIKNLDRCSIPENASYHGFKYEVMHRRYLFIFGGLIKDESDATTSKTFCIDLQRKKLLLTNEFDYRLPAQIIPNCHYFLNDIIYIIGGTISWDIYQLEPSEYIDSCYWYAFWKLKVSFQDDVWTRMRKIWIGFMKNDTCECLFASLHKDIIKTIEKFVQPKKFVWVENVRQDILKILVKSSKQEK